MTKIICDRCGFEIKKNDRPTYVGVGQSKHDLYDQEMELCVSCAFRLKKWLKGEHENEKTD